MSLLSLPSPPVDITDHTRTKLWDRLIRQLMSAGEQVTMLTPQRSSGQLIKVSGLIMEVAGCRMQTGQRCLVQGSGGLTVEAEVVGFDRNTLLLMPIEYHDGLSPGARVTSMGDNSSILVGDALLGRVIDGAGRPLDSKPKPAGSANIRLHSHPINPLQRCPVATPLDVGVRSVNGLLTIGRGQRIGLFAGSGSGKSTLLGMIARNTSADIVVLAMIGERGREVGDFIRQNINNHCLQRSIVVAAPADHSPVMRLRAALVAHRIAEYYRDTGHHTLLLMDSLTRYAQARREVGLATGEPPAARGYPPSAFNMIARLVERAGNGYESSGSLTAFYTVLTEGEQDTDPISESARAILDGHLVLSHALAISGHYPAIDVVTSISRTMPQSVSDEHLKMSLTFRRLLEKAREGSELKLLGVYQPGNDPDMDMAMAAEPGMLGYLQQGIEQRETLEDSVQQLKALISGLRHGHQQKTD
ncbi:FliI/YscN family ATPase [Salinisphaera sp. G21_0]|uniref:FliI/YscN family ATPase n=1 Tax=Salinisphaera sp. G21_0 TaxID=2821094 RepID=UPI003369CF9D